MKKYFPLLFILFSFGALSAQNLNFKDTNGLKSLLCSHTWYRYNVNPDSVFSDKIADSIKFYANGTLYKSAKPKNNLMNGYLDEGVMAGTWHFGSSGRASRNDTATDCISMEAEFIIDKGHIVLSSFSLFDGHRMKGTKLGKKSGNLDKPFIGLGGAHSDLDCSISDIWQPHRQFKKSKQK